MPLIDSYCVSFVSILLSAQNRKHCAICKCPRDVHDVTHKESVNVHDRLGLNKEGEEEHQHRHQHQQQQHPQLPASSSRVMPLNKGARPTSSDVYSWIPAGLTPDQVKYSPTGGRNTNISFPLLFPPSLLPAAREGVEDCVGSRRSGRHEKWWNKSRHLERASSSPFSIFTLTDGVTLATFSNQGQQTRLRWRLGAGRYAAVSPVRDPSGR